MEIVLANKAQCCGCGTCVLACPANAIEMVPGELGCLYPKINREKCIGCHACEKACFLLNGKRTKPAEQKVYAAAAMDKAVLKKSASGGIFGTIAHSVVDAGGIVYGCSLEMVNGTLTPMHIGAESHEDVLKLQGSKYVQSALGTVFVDIREHLKQGRSVLFSGTPCQVDALRHYLKDTDTSRLFTMDLICHGVPSAELFEAYLRNLGRKNNGRVSAFHFRDKQDGWGLNASCCIEKPEGAKKQKVPTGLSSYYSLFLQSEIYRENCYSCPYANTDRVGDVTIGDFWGVEQEHPELLVENNGNLSVQEGISAMLVNTVKGHQLLERFGQDLILNATELKKASKWNRQLRGPSTHTNTRKELTAIYHRSGYDGIERFFRRNLGLRYIVRVLKFKLRNR